MPVTSWSTSPSSNNAAPPNGWPEGMAAAAVNDTARQMMADLVVEFQRNPVKVLGTVAGTNTITAAMTPALTAYSAGMTLALTPANTNTGATTLNINSLGALDVFRYGGEALQAGDLVAGVPAHLLLDSGADDFYLLNPQNTGFRNLPQNVQGSGYTLVLADAGKYVANTNTAVTITVPPNSSVAFPLGSVVTIVNQNGVGNISIAQGAGVTLTLAGTATTGTRTLAGGAGLFSVATILKIATDTWVISGTGLS